LRLFSVVTHAEEPSVLSLLYACARSSTIAALFNIAYGWPHNLTDEQILERLLTLNLERAAQQEAERA
jgi:hypothetical protein